MFFPDGNVDMKDTEIDYSFLDEGIKPLGLHLWRFFDFGRILNMFLL